MNKSIWKKVLAGLAAAALILTGAACGSPGTDDVPADDSLQHILDKGELVLGFDTEFPPMGFVNESGEAVGFDIDVAQEVCSRLGVRLVKRGINWERKEHELNSGAIDCIWNGLSITPARSATMNLTEPYMKNELIFVVPATSDVMRLSDLKGKTVGVQTGSTAKEVMSSSDDYPDVSVLGYGGMLTLLEALDSGKVDAALLDSVIAYYYVFSKEGEYFILSDSLAEEEYAVAFRKSDQVLRDRVPEIISDMKGDGSLGNISAKWFGSDITTVK